MVRMIVASIAVAAALGCASTPEARDRALEGARATWAVADSFASVVVEGALGEGAITAEQAAAFRAAEKAVTDALASATVDAAVVAAWRSAEPVALQQIDRLATAGKMTAKQASTARLGVLAFGAALQVLAAQLGAAP